MLLLCIQKRFKIPYKCATSWIWYLKKMIENRKKKKGIFEMENSSYFWWKYRVILFENNSLKKITTLILNAFAISLKLYHSKNYMFHIISSELSIFLSLTPDKNVNDSLFQVKHVILHILDIDNRNYKIIICWRVTMNT